MEIFPAIDIIGKKAVRLFKGEYDKATVYGEPIDFARKFIESGAKNIHIVDLEGALNGDTPNVDTIKEIIGTGLFAEIGGGIRNLKVVEKYLEIGASRVIIGTAAVTDEQFLKTAIGEFGEKIAVGADIKDGFIAIKGWTEKSLLTADAFFDKICELGVKTVICTDISRDGAMMGTNRALYAELSKKYKVNIIASGGVSSLEDIAELKKIPVHGAIIGKAYYTGAIDLKKALEIAK